MKKIVERFKNFKKEDYILLIPMFIILVVGLYMSIAFSIKLANGYTLFGDSSNAKNVLEVSGPTQADIYVLILYWVLTVLLLALFIYTLFFKKTSEQPKVKKDIINGESVIVKEENQPKNESK